VDDCYDSRTANDKAHANTSEYSKHVLALETLLTDVDDEGVPPVDDIAPVDDEDPGAPVEDDDKGDDKPVDEEEEATAETPVDEEEEATADETPVDEEEEENTDETPVDDTPVEEEDEEEFAGSVAAPLTPPAKKTSPDASTQAVCWKRDDTKLGKAAELGATVDHAPVPLSYRSIVSSDEDRPDRVGVLAPVDDDTVAPPTTNTLPVLSSEEVNPTRPTLSTPALDHVFNAGL